MSAYFPASVDVHRADPHWDYDPDENPYPGTSYLAGSALIRSVPVLRAPVGETRKEEAHV